VNEQRVVERVRTVCAALPEVVEEQAWVGTRWRVRGKTFAHVLSVEKGWPPAYAKAAGTEGPARLVMFRSSGEELNALRAMGRPFFAPPWRRDELGLVIDRATDWADLAELLVESYCVLAPKRLRQLVTRPENECGIAP
jgi:hypothetical protein